MTNDKEYRKSNTDYISKAKKLAENNYYHDLSGNFISTFIKRGIRRIIRFIFLPIINNQNEFNKSIIAAVEEEKYKQIQIDTLDLHEKQIEKLHDEIYKLEKRIEELEGNKNA